jgi:hypothetical protein
MGEMKPKQPQTKVSNKNEIGNGVRKAPFPKNETQTIFQTK